MAEPGNTRKAVINGNSSSSIEGIIYMPDERQLHYSGGGSTTGGCVRLIAQEITLIGSSRFAIDCGLKVDPMQTMALIRLAE